ncbi:hypothetical protein ACJVC5_16790 [Peredibacter sp. HCB2-198]|uniref:hypothetical protein n=1 Tax=Peredibacter sp. HCB2-198 TaxID=3383025 RepID=UPI0038B58FE3
MKFLTALVLSMALAAPSFACTEDGKGGFLPENDLSIPVGSKLAGGLTEAQFNAVIDKLEVIYAPIVAQMGGRLTINRKWTDATVNANATRMGGWIVNMYGGLARHNTITEDGFALVLCHELGHHLGGAPKVGNLFNKWASNEGQADYFATLKCLRKAFLNDNNAQAVARMNVPTTLSEACAKAWPNKDDRAICIRNGMAGVSVAGLFAALRNQPEGKFETPDTNVVSRTDDAHPAHQCRLDTYFQGALCEKSFNEDVSQNDEVKGTCHGKTGYKVGLRPLCWFKPKK